MRINEFIDIEISSRKNLSKGGIDELPAKLTKCDTLLVTELYQFGRNILQTLNITNELSEQDIKIAFVHQPELSITGHQPKLLLTIFSYFAEKEREYIPLRTK